MFVGISLPALCTGLAGLILCSSAHAQTIRPSTQKELKVFDPTASATGHIGIRAAAGTVSYTLTLPAAAPSVNQVLSVNAVSVGTVSLTWATPVSGTGTTNYLSKFASAGTLTNSQVFDNGTYVGIGTATPTYKLDVNGGSIGVNTSGQTRTISTFYGADSEGVNIFIGGGGNSSVGAVGQTYKGAYNTSVGVNALLSNTTGYNNSAMGSQALYYNTTGYNNSAIGLNALVYNTTGYNNTGLGYGAGISPTDEVGSKRITTDYDMTLIGYGATKNSASQLNNSIAIGVGTLVTTSNTAMWGNASMTRHIFQAGNVGIGTTSPNSQLTVVSPWTTTTGSGTPLLSISGNNNSNSSFVGGANFSPTIGTLGTINLTLTAVAVSPTFFANNSSTISNAYSLYLSATKTGEQALTNAYSLYVDAPTGATNNYAAVFNGRVGIGTTSPGVKLEIKDGDLRLSKSPEPTYNLDLNWNYDGNNSFNMIAAGNTFMEYNTNTGYTLFNQNNVGIGTTNPQHLLTLSKTGTYQLRLHNSGAGGGYWNIAQADNSFTSGGGKLIFVPNAEGSANATVAFLNTGNVGIGTTSPNNLLSVAGTLTKSLTDGTGWGLMVEDTKSQAAGVGGGIIFRGYKIAQSNSANFGAIAGIKENGTSGNELGALAFYVNVGGLGVLEEKMRINSSGQIATPLGSVGAPSYSFVGDLNTGIYSSGADAIGLVTGGVARLTANSVGEVIVTRNFKVEEAGLSNAIGGNFDGTSVLTVYAGTSSMTALKLRAAASQTAAIMQWANSGNTVLGVINSGGNVLIGKTSSSFSTNGIELNTNGSGCFWTGSNATLLTMNRIGTNDHLILFKNDGTDCGAITIAGTNTTNFNTTSDYRLKEDLKDFNGLALVSKIPVYDFQWKRDSTRSYGVMAHELQSVLPYAVSGTKDGENTQGVDYSKIVPLLVKAIQEQQVQLDQLKAEQTTTSSLLRQLQLDLQSIQKPNTVHKE
jgi:hypothetical protein